MKWLFLLYMIMTMQVDFTDSDQATLAKAVGMKNSKRLESLHNQSKSHKSFKRIFDQYNYLENNSSIILQSFGPKLRSKIRFLHIPKTGTTLAATVVHYCCDVDGTYVDVVRQFSSIVPSYALPTMCSADWLAIQPRSPNGDPWAHIPYRAGTDIPGTIIAMFRQPLTRLASQLAYMQVIGPKLSATFGFRRSDAYILYHLLTFNYDNTLKRYLSVMRTKSERAVMPTSLRPEAFGLNSTTSAARLLDFSGGQYLNLAQDCIKMQKQLHLPTYNQSMLYNLTYSVNHIQERLHKHFGEDLRGLQSFMECGLRAAVHYPGLLGCQTRLLLGRNCFDSYTLTAEDIAEAKRRVEKEFLFVGISYTTVVIVSCSSILDY